MIGIREHVGSMFGQKVEMTLQRKAFSYTSRYNPKYHKSSWIFMSLSLVIWNLSGPTSMKLHRSQLKNILTGFPTPVISYCMEIKNIQDGDEKTNGSRKG